MTSRQGRPPSVLAAGAFIVFLAVALALKHIRRGSNQPRADGFVSLSVKERMELLLQEWKTIMDTQMHFNDMIIRMRTLGVTAVVTVFGAAAFAIGQYPSRFYTLFGERFHVSEGVIFFGLVLWAAIFFIDFFYYFKLLLGAVSRAYEIDDAFHELRYFGDLRPFGMSRRISEAIGRGGLAQWLILGFYVAVFSVGLGYFVAVHIIVDPPAPGVVP